MIRMNRELESFYQKLNIVEAIRNKGLQDTLGYTQQVLVKQVPKQEPLRKKTENNLGRCSQERCWKIQEEDQIWKEQEAGWDGWKAECMTGSET